MKKVDTLRVSITDRCNLSCTYCRPPEGVPLFPHDEILSFEEIERVVRAAVSVGVTKVRITGGEPLVRRGILELLAALSKISGISDLPMTTNGVLLADQAKDLKQAGLNRVTVSMDTLKPDRYEKIAGKPCFDRVMGGIEAALRAQLLPLKLNVVVVPGENDDEVTDFVRLAQKLDLEVRFIEKMPLINRDQSPHCGLPGEDYVPSKTLRERIEAEIGKITPVSGSDPGQPARVYELPGGVGRVGFIAPISEPFCAECKRMRLTPDGKLRACLAQDKEIDIKGPIRGGITDGELLKIYKKAVAIKPEQEAACFTSTNRVMSQIGG